jgi:phage-related tail fiber protein
MTDQNSQFFAILTNIGVAKQANADALGIAWKITQMGVGDANGTDPQPDANQKTLIREWRRAPLNQLKQDPSNPAIIIAEQVIPAEIGGNWIREIGLYDADGDLVAVANCAPSYKPTLAQGSGRTQVVRMNLIVSNTVNVELKIDPSVVLATREFVLGELAKQDFKSSVLVCAPGNVVLSGIQTIDGIAVPAGKRVLNPFQTAAKDRGIWVTAAGAWTRATDADISEEVTPGMLVLVEQGTQYSDSAWQLVTDAPITLGVTALTFEMAWGRTGVTPGEYRSVTVDKLGRVVAATNPTTVAGYGLTDVYTKTQIDTALAQKASLNSPVLTGLPKAPTAPTSTNSDQIATTAFVQALLTALVGAAPETLNQINEIAAALGNDPNFATTIMTLMAQKAPLASPVLTGDPRAPTPAQGDNDTSIATTAFVQAALAMFGVGASAAVITDYNAITASGFYRDVGTAVNAPLATTMSIIHVQWSGNAGLQIAAAATAQLGSSRIFWRNAAGGSWSGWKEFGALDSPVMTGDPKAPTPAVTDNDTSVATTAFVYSVLSALGIAPGAKNNNELAQGTDLNAVLNFGVYSQPATANATLALNYPKAVAGTLLVLRGSATFVNQVYQEYNTGQLWTRSIYNGVPSAWLQSASIDSPVLTGDPRAPTQNVGDNDTSIATTAFVQAALAAFGIGSFTGPLAADLNTTVLGGAFRTTNATANTPVTGNLSGFTFPYNNGGCLQIASQLGGVGRLFWRTQAGSTWSPWREVAGTDSPALLGNPTAPTPGAGDNSQSIATTAFVRGAAGDMVGMVAHFAMPTPPDGWLKRNGAAVSRTTYAALFAKIGTAWGAGDGSTTFNLPDARGYFDRAWDDSRGIDTGRAFASNQAPQNQSHTHSGTALTSGVHSHVTDFVREKLPVANVTDGGNAVLGDQITDGIQPMTSSTDPGHTHTLSIASSGGTEARPYNQAYLACIKY